MKSKPFGALFGLLALVAILGVAPAFGSTEVDIQVGAGSSASAACVTTNNCFSPNPVNVAPGDEVEWKNGDTISHTVTSGKVSDDVAGSLFDSGLIKKGNEFKFTFANAGTYDYFCAVHPWMTGQVIVGGAASTTSTAPTTMTPMSNMTNATSTSAIITVTAAPAIGNQTGISLGVGAPYTAPSNNTSAVTAAPTTMAPISTMTNTTSTTTVETEAASSPTYIPPTGQPSPSQAGQGQQNGIPLGSAYTSNTPSSSGIVGEQYNDSNNPNGPLSVAAWAAGIAIFGVMTGVGIWTTVRKH